MGKKITDYMEELKQGKTNRETLSAIRSEIKEKEKMEQLQIVLDKDYSLFLALLNSEDAKTRKNAALLLGDFQCNENIQALQEAYDKETQLFVKSSYLTALGKLDYEEILPYLKERLDIVTAIEPEENSRKHIQEEIRELNQMILAKEGMTAHDFKDGKVSFDVVLLTNRNHKEIIADQIKDLPDFNSSEMKVLNQGIRIQTKEILPLFQIRTWTEMLFFVKGMKTTSKDPKEAATVICNSHILEFLKGCHKGTSPFYFRVEVKSKMELDKKSVFAKKLSGYIEEFTQRQLINSPTNYEVELRFIEDKEGKFNVCLKLFTLKDYRFQYRSEITPTSIKPVNAATIVSVAMDYMMMDARVLDPFCGVGTMLIERQMQAKGNTSYGIDIMEDAIHGAKINTEAAGQIIHYINRDFFDFTHEYVFDEIFTNMPFAIGRKTKEEIEMLYKKFFQKAGSHLIEQGRIIMYTHNKEYVEFFAPNYGYQILAKEEIMKKEETFLFVLEKL